MLRPGAAMGFCGPIPRNVGHQLVGAGPVKTDGKSEAPQPLYVPLNAFVLQLLFQGQ